MAEQENNQEVTTPEVTTSTTESNERQYTEIEQRAMEQGWVPEDQYQGTGKWRDAEEFLDRGELFTKIDESTRRAKNAEKTVEELRKHLNTVRETEFKKALAQLKAEKAAAVAEGDGAKVVEIDEEIAEAREQYKEAEKAATTNLVDDTPHPQFVAWANRNSWYKSDKAMQIYANTVGQEMVAAGETNPARVLEEIERRVKKEFAHKFVNPNRGKPGAVETGNGKGSVRKDNFQLSEDETKAMKRFVRAGILTEEQYIADIKASRGE